MVERREPERTCVGCRRKSPKAGLVRIVRSPGGPVGIDRTGRASGRGAYVHPEPECLRRASRGRALAHALRTGLEPAEAASLMAELTQEASTR